MSVQAARERFGHYLRKIRHQRILTLDQVSTLSDGFPARITKSHLSRLEQGTAVPTFPRMLTLSLIYEVPLDAMARRYHAELGGATTRLKETSEAGRRAAARLGRRPEASEPIA